MGKKAGCGVSRARGRPSIRQGPRDRLRDLLTVAIKSSLIRPVTFHAPVDRSLIGGAIVVAGFPLLGRFAPRAGLVTSRQTFVRRCHAGDEWPPKAEAVV